MNNYNVLFYLFVIVMVIVFVFGVWMFEFIYEEFINGKNSENNGFIMEILILFLKF